MAHWWHFAGVLTLRGALAYLLLCVILATIKLSGSQNQALDLADNETNITILACQNVDNRTQCVDLPASCVDCDFFGQNDLPDCVYGVITNFSCWPLDYVECAVRDLINNRVLRISNLY